MYKSAFQRLAYWVKSTDDVVKYFSYFSQKIVCDSPYKLFPLETIYMDKVNILGKVRKKCDNFSCVELAQGGKSFINMY